MADSKKLFIGADHAGFELKNSLMKFLVTQGYQVTDLGAAKLDPDDDYPIIAKKVADKVKATRAPGILLCGNAEGVCIASNKIKGIRAAIGYSVFSAEGARNDDDANILCLPGRTMKLKEAQEIALKFLNTKFSEAPRHLRRLTEISELEK